MNVKYEITAERRNVKDVVRSILSCILFHRLFGLCAPQSREVLGITYPCVATSSIDSLIEERTSQLVRSNESGGEIGLQFFEQRVKRATWFGRAQEDRCWEQWIISVAIVNAKSDTERESLNKKTEKQLREIFLSIVSTVNEHKDHIPPITTTDSTPFPFEIVVPGTSQGEGWGTVFKKMLSD